MKLILADAKKFKRDKKIGFASFHPGFLQKFTDQKYRISNVQDGIRIIGVVQMTDGKVSASVSIYSENGVLLMMEMNPMPEFQPHGEFKAVSAKCYPDNGELVPLPTVDPNEFEVIGNVTRAQYDAFCDYYGGWLPNEYLEFMGGAETLKRKSDGFKFECPANFGGYTDGEYYYWFIVDTDVKIGVRDDSGQCYIWDWDGEVQGPFGFHEAREKLASYMPSQ
ncbi:MAG: hypothetical protein R2688_00985 [Fimbriimonadaceae bacterium]